MNDVLVTRQARAGRITLNRPAALNALTPRMVETLRRALDELAGDPAVALVIVDAVGERAFCAGGDIVWLHRTGRDDPATGRAFWRDEYRLNAAIARYPKPIVTLLDGIAMGGGVGLGCHAAHRIVTERSVLAMPEAGIGFSPDVGGTWLLAHAPGHLGEYLAATGAHMTGADALFAGFADRFLASDRLGALVQSLAATGDAAAIADFVSPPPPSRLEAEAAAIDTHFATADVHALVEGLRGSAFADATAALVARNAPFSVAAAIEAVRRARQDAALEDSLAREYRYSYRVLERDDFYEGVRAAVVDKDRQPRWRPATLAEVDSAEVAAAFAPLGEHEWTP